VSLNLASVSLPDKINFHKQEGEVLYNGFSKNSMTIRKAKTLLENSANKVKMEKAN